MKTTKAAAPQVQQVASQEGSTDISVGIGAAGKATAKGTTGIAVKGGLTVSATANASSYAEVTGVAITEGSAAAAWLAGTVAAGSSDAAFAYQAFGVDAVVIQTELEIGAAVEATVSSKGEVSAQAAATGEIIEADIAPSASKFVGGASEKIAIKN